MARPIPRYSSEGSSDAERVAVDLARFVASNQRAPGPVSVDWGSNAPDIDALTRMAGLTGGSAALGAAIVATGKWPPGFYSAFMPSSGKPEPPGSEFSPDPLRLRGWAVAFAPSLIDPGKTWPDFSGALWW